MSPILYLMYIRKIPKADLKKMEGKHLYEITDLAKPFGYEVLAFSAKPLDDAILNTSERYSELLPYLSDVIHMDVVRVIDEEKIKREHKIPATYYCEKQEAEREGTRYFFEDSHDSRKPMSVYISDKDLHEKYMKSMSQDIRVAYVQRYGVLFEGPVVNDVLAMDNKKPSQSRKMIHFIDDHFFKITPEMYKHVYNDIFKIPFVSNTREALFYKYENY